jgi:GNAT superfamily N-acetyltransferase
MVRAAGQADLQALTGLMRGFYAESGFVLDDERARVGFEALLADARLGRAWIIEHEPSKVGPATAAGYVVVTFVFAMEYGGMVAAVDDFFVRPEARGEGLGTAALAEVRWVCAGLGMRALRVEVGTDNPIARAVYRSAGFESLPDRGVMAAPLAPPTHRE